MTEIETTRTSPAEGPRAEVEELGRAAARLRAIDPTTTLAELIHLAFARSVDQILRHAGAVRDGDDPEDVHQLRVGIRRLHSDLRTFAPILRSEPLRSLRSELQWLGGSVGALRDCEVLMKRLASEVRSLKRADQSGIAVLDARIREEHAAERAAMLEALQSTREAALVDSLVTFADDPAIRPKRNREASKVASLAAPRFVRAPWKKLSDAVVQLGTTPTDAALHQVRILTKRCRYAAEAVAPVVPEAGAFAKALADVQTVLGDHHDTVVAEAWLVAAARDEPASARIAFDLVFRERASRARLRARWPALWDLAAAEELRTWL